MCSKRERGASASEGEKGRGSTGKSADIARQRRQGSRREEKEIKVLQITCPLLSRA
jgi:hypothetical protein